MYLGFCCLAFKTARVNNSFKCKTIFFHFDECITIFFLVDKPYFQFVPEIVIYKEIFTSSSTMDMEKSKL